MYSEVIFQLKDYFPTMQQDRFFPLTIFCQVQYLASLVLVPSQKKYIFNFSGYLNILTVATRNLTIIKIFYFFLSDFLRSKNLSLNSPLNCLRQMSVK